MWGGGGLRAKLERARERDSERVCIAEMKVQKRRTSVPSGTMVRCAVARPWGDWAVAHPTSESSRPHGPRRPVRLEWATAESEEVEVLAMPAALLPEFHWRYPAAARWLRDLAEMRQVVRRLVVLEMGGVELKSPDAD